MALGMLGKYERLDILGHGASGIVYLAQDTLLRRHVALKEITAQGDEMRRVLEEARVLDRLRHPNIVAVHGVDTINGKVVIDMEYVEGSNLLEIMRQADGPLPIDEAVDFAIQICDGLAYAHSHRTVHRDIKPANILVSTDLRVKLADFGLAQVLGTNSYAGGAGTYAYMAPEDFHEASRSDHQSDLWAVGVILYEMLTGRRPFVVTNARDPFAWGRAVTENQVEPPSSCLSTIPAGLDAICLTALQVDKARRYQQASEIASDLRALPIYETDGERILVPLTVSVGSGDAEGNVPTILIAAPDVDALLHNAPSHWDELQEHLESGVLARWLESISEPLLARVAQELSHDKATDIESRLRDFLYRAGLELEPAARKDALVGREMISLGKYAEAVEMLERAVNLDPSHPSYFRMLAQAGKNAGDIELAKEVLYRGVMRHPLDRALKRDMASVGGARPQISTNYVNFGQLRHGETRTVDVVLRSIDNQPVKGRIATAPAWLKVTPLAFSTRPKQVFKLTAESGNLPREPQEFEEKLVFETSGGSIDLPVALVLLPTRPPFSAVFRWYMPVLIFCILPVLVGQYVTMSSYGKGVGRPLAPAGLISGGILFASFLAINIIADTQIRERTVAIIGMLLLPIGLFYIINLSQTAPHSLVLAWPAIIETAIPSLAVPTVQAVTLVKSRETFDHWPLWCLAIAAASLVVSAILWYSGVAQVQ